MWTRGMADLSTSYALYNVQRLRNIVIKLKRVNNSKIVFLLIC